MIEIIIRPRDMGSLRCHIDTNKVDITHNVSHDIGINDGSRCHSCPKDDMHHRCYLLDALFPVVVYFSELYSYEEVLIVIKRKKSHSHLCETAQRACFIVMLHIMFNSRCEFFGRHRFLFQGYGNALGYTIFVHFLLTIFLLGRRGDPFNESVVFGVGNEASLFNREFSRRISSVMWNARRLQRRDAAVNALNDMLVLNSMSLDGLKEYCRLLDGIE